MERLRSGFKILTEDTPDENLYKYEQLVNRESLGINDSPHPMNLHELKEIPSNKFVIEEETQSTPLNPFEELHDPLDEVPVPRSPVDDDESGFKIGNVKVSFFSSNFKSDMKKILKSFVLIYSLMIVLIIFIGSIFYGTLYHRQAYLQQNLTIHIINNDQHIGLIPTLIGDQLEFITRNEKRLRSQVTFIHQTSGDFDEELAKTNSSIHDILQKNILEKKTWGYIYIANCSHSLFDTLKHPGSKPHFDTNVFQIYYQTSRDVKIVKSYLLPVLNQIEHYYQESYSSRVLIPLVNDWLEESELSELLKHHKDLLFSLLKFNYQDLNQFNDPVLLAPMTVGLIMMIIVSFFQFNFFLPVHNLVAARIQPRHYIYFRLISSQISYFFLGLGFTALFYIFSKEKSGFFIYWIITYLALSAVGGVNENMALILFVTYPPLHGFWLVFWVILNISPSLNLIETLPAIYKYGYGLPIYNYLECLKVIVLDSWKGELHRNILILVAWVVFNNILFPFTIKFFSHRMALNMAQH